MQTSLFAQWSIGSVAGAATIHKTRFLCYLEMLAALGDVNPLEQGGQALANLLAGH